MRLELGLLFAAGVGYLVVLFLVAYATERGLIPARLSRHPAISTLALGVYASSWSFNGAVGFAKLEGYRFLADYVILLNRSNPQIASRQLTPLTRWRKYDSKRQELMKGELRRIMAEENLSKDVYEVLSKSLQEQ
jgi:aminopeptidase N